MMMHVCRLYGWGPPLVVVGPAVCTLVCSLEGSSWGMGSPVRRLPHLALFLRLPPTKPHTHRVRIA